MSMIVHGRTFSIRSARLEGAVVALIREWAIAHPDELAALDKLVKAYRYASNGMTDGGNMAHSAEIPVTLSLMMSLKIKRDWVSDPEIWRIFKRNFVVGMVRRDGEMRR